MDHPSTARSEERWDRTFMVSVDTRRRRCPWRFWRSPGAQNQGSTKKTYKMVGKILDTHLLATLTCAVYANSPSQWVKSVITRYFFRTLYTWGPPYSTRVFLQGDAKITCDHTLQLLRR